jgi:hypothetical protein
MLALIRNDVGAAPNKTELSKWNGKTPLSVLYFGWS